MEENYKVKFLTYLGTLAREISSYVRGYTVWNGIEVQILRATDPFNGEKTEWVITLQPAENWKSVIIMINPDDPVFGGIKNKLKGEKITWTLPET